MSQVILFLVSKGSLCDHGKHLVNARCRACERIEYEQRAQPYLFLIMALTVILGTVGMILIAWWQL
jgi:hypothetical protein